MLPRSLSKATLAWRVCLCSCPQPLPWSTIPYTPPFSQESAHHSTIPSSLTTEGQTLFTVFGDRGKGLLGKSCTHWLRNLAHTELHLSWFILLCSLRLTW